MVMVDCCELMAHVHERMPTILAFEDWQLWMDGAPDEALALCRVWEGPLVVERTPEA
jgi:putative SOS response-associated peptidase YedK